MSQGNTPAKYGDTTGSNGNNKVASAICETRLDQTRQNVAEMRRCVSPFVGGLDVLHLELSAPDRPDCSVGGGNPLMVFSLAGRTGLAEKLAELLENFVDGIADVTELLTPEPEPADDDPDSTGVECEMDIAHTSTNAAEGVLV